MTNLWVTWLATPIYKNHYLFNSPLSDILATSSTIYFRRLSHDFHKFSERVRNHSLFFYELSDVVLHNMSQIMTAEDKKLLLTPPVSSISWWIQWTGIIFAYLATAMVLYLFYKFQIFGSAIAFFKTTSAAQPTNFSLIFVIWKR